MTRVVLLAATTLVACGAAEAQHMRASRGAVQEGKAAWYGGKFQGRKTASGERFDKNKMTAAHRTLPFGTRVRVTHVASGRSVVVRINDRGPFGRAIIDLSEAAARKLGILRAGVAQVRIEVLETPRADRARRRR